MRTMKKSSPSNVVSVARRNADSDSCRVAPAGQEASPIQKACTEALPSLPDSRIRLFGSSTGSLEPMSASVLSSVFQLPFASSAGPAPAPQIAPPWFPAEGSASKEVFAPPVVETDTSHPW